MTKLPDGLMELLKIGQDMYCGKNRRFEQYEGAAIQAAAMKLFEEWRWLQYKGGVWTK
jgi:hypothetical protein